MLTDIFIKTLKHSGSTKPDRHIDRDQLYLYVFPTETKSWRLRYRLNGKEDMLVIGHYPQFSLKEARLEAIEARALIARGIDPKEAKRKARLEEVSAQANQFAAIAQKWISVKEHELAEGTLRKHKSRLKKYLIPSIGKTPVSKLTRRQILQIGETIQTRGALHEAHRVIRLCKQILEYAVLNDVIEYNIAYGLTKGLAIAKTKHRAAPINDQDIRIVLQLMASHRGAPQVHACLQLAPHLFMSPVDLAHGKWEDLDLEARTWSFKRKKTGTPTIAPLSNFVITQLQQMKYIFPDTDWIFPSCNGKNGPISPGSLNAAIRRVGVRKDQATIHGFRATARTLLVEKFGYRQDIVEQQISHAVRDPNGRAYNRATFLSERREMMETWSDYLLRLANNKLKIVA